MEKLVAFSYLEDDDRTEFEKYMGTENEDILVAGSRTANRLERYLPSSEMEAIRVFFTAVVRDFQLPGVRFSLLIAVSFYEAAMERRNVTAEVKEIVNSELGFALKHLMTDEKVEFDGALDLIAKHWDEYVSNPNGFVLSERILS